MPKIISPYTFETLVFKRLSSLYIKNLVFDNKETLFSNEIALQRFRIVRIQELKRLLNKGGLV